MTERTIGLIDGRRRLILAKTITPENKKSCRNDKNQHIARVCQELKEHANTNRSHELYDIVKYLSREFKPQTQIIKYNGETITNANSIAEVWTQYCKKLS